MRVCLAAAALLLSACSSVPTQRSAVETAATQPLRDVRIRDDQMPEVLRLAQSAPYSTRGTERCAAITEEVRRLDAVLGPDADSGGSEPGRGAALAAAGIRAAMGRIIPGLGLVRVATGADQQQRRVEEAIVAGSLRRSFLKGLGASRGCAPPSAPGPQSQGAVQTLETSSRD